MFPYSVALRFFAAVYSFTNVVADLPMHILNKQVSSYVVASASRSSFPATDDPWSALPSNAKRRMSRRRRRSRGGPVSA
jgi:hypothetical protein